MRDMVTTWDVAVVGAGPAGITAARVAAQKGLSVALIERRKRLSPITRACSEGLLYDEPYYGESIRLDRESGNIVFSPSGLTLRYTGPVREIPYFDNVSFRGRRMHVVREDRKPIHLVIDKARYLEENLEEAKRLGVCFFPDQTVVDLDIKEEQVVVQTNQRTFTARFLIAADGHNSLCARIAGFNKQRTFYGTLTAAGWHIEGPEPGEQGHVHLVQGSDEPSVFCLCPRVEHGQWSVIISGFRLEPEYDKIFEAVTSRSVLAPLFKPKFKVIRRIGCILNLFYPLENPCDATVYIVGDGAWFGQTSNSHAALTGARAAECIAMAMHKTCSVGDAAREYRRWWQTRFYESWHPPGANIFEYLTADEIDELFSYLPAEIPGSMEPGKAKRMMGAFLQQILPTLHEKSPQLLERIACLQHVSPETVRGEKEKRGIAVRSLIRTTG